MSYKIEIKNIESVTVATMRYNGPMTEATKYFPNVFKAIKESLTGHHSFATMMLTKNWCCRNGIMCSNC